MFSSRKSQMEIGETILTLFIFVILFVIVILFLVKLYGGSSAKRELEKKQADTYSSEIVKFVENMNEITCPNTHSDSNLCIDLVSFNALSEMIKDNEDLYQYYYDYLGTSNITLEISYWWNYELPTTIIKKNYVLYDEALIKENLKSSEKINVYPKYVPVIVHDPIFKKDMMGVLIITYTAKSVLK